MSGISTRATLIHTLVASVIAGLALMSATAHAADYSSSEQQMVRSVLERQNTLIQIETAVLPRINSESIRTLLTQDIVAQRELRASLLATASSQGMAGVDSLQPPPYFQRMNSQLLALNETALAQQTLLLVLQCHAFLGRSVNAELRTGSNTALLNWAKQHIEAMEQSARDIDHALYDLK